MKKIILRLIFLVDVAAVIIYGVCSTLIEKCHIVTGVVTDGFGRILKPTPILVRYLLYMRNWAGFKWFVIDTVCFWALVIIGVIFYHSITDDI